MAVGRIVSRGNADFLVQKIHVEEIKAVFFRNHRYSVENFLCILTLKGCGLEEQQRYIFLLAKINDLQKICFLLVHYLAALSHAFGALKFITAHAVKEITALEVFKAIGPGEISEIVVAQLVKAVVIHREAQHQIEPLVLGGRNLDSLKLIL